jgi:hypothetical protein
MHPARRAHHRFDNGRVGNDHLRDVARQLDEARFVQLHRHRAPLLIGVLREGCPAEESKGCKRGE